MKIQKAHLSEVYSQYQLWELDTERDMWISECEILRRDLNAVKIYTTRTRSSCGGFVFVCEREMKLVQHYSCFFLPFSFLLSVPQNQRSKWASEILHSPLFSLSLSLSSKLHVIRMQYCLVFARRKENINNSN